MSSVERISYYSKTEPELWEGRPAPLNWPSHGAISIQNLELRYRPELPAVLSSINAEIRAGEKIGVVGRTGSGKSSLLLGVYRILEPSAGRILVDGVDIGAIALRDLREALAIIPQDPVLFKGSIRKNLDPFNECSDQQLWQVLEKSHLKNVIEKLAGGLEAAVAEGGTNLSVGQRQLLCLGRAMIRKNKILLLDEATASVDVSTDALVQSTLREAFQDCTVITIAHRLSTVLDSSRIMVLENGSVVEFDKPRNLLSARGGALRGLLEQAGQLAVG